MKKIALTYFSLFIFALGCSTAKTGVEFTSPEKYMSGITAGELKKHLEIVASDEMEGRETGSKGQKKAGEYMIAQYKANNISFPKGAKTFYQTVPAAYLNAKYKENLPDSENIWAFIEGSDKKNEIIVISAHYDHIGIKKGQIYNGADDDGSGTVALMEIAQAFNEAKKAGNGPRRSILILHVTGEEHGLHGSRFYSENPLFPLKHTVANINIDMIGRRDTFHPDTNNYVYVIGSDRLSTDLHKITEEVNNKYLQLTLDYKYNDLNDPEKFYYRSDHYNFAKNGIPAVFFFNGTHADYHKPTDKVDKIEYDALTKRTKLAFVTAWELANRENRIVVDRDGK